MTFQTNLRGVEAQTCPALTTPVAWFQTNLRGVEAPGSRTAPPPNSWFQTNLRGVEAVGAPDQQRPLGDCFRRTFVGLKRGGRRLGLGDDGRFRRTFVGLKRKVGVVHPLAGAGFRRTFVGLKLPGFTSPKEATVFQTNLRGVEAAHQHRFATSRCVSDEPSWG